jgi:hypothetical protein
MCPLCTGGRGGGGRDDTHLAAKVLARRVLDLGRDKAQHLHAALAARAQARRRVRLGLAARRRGAQAHPQRKVTYVC